jgi:uncharacterized protein (TIGR01244 family)
MNVHLKRGLIIVLLVAIIGGGIAAYRKLYYLPRFYTVAEGRLTRSRQPRHGNFWVLHNLGVRRLICLYEPHEIPDDLAAERQWCADTGVEFVHIPVSDHGVPKVEQVEEFLRAVRTSPGPVHFHCVAGRRRSSIMEAAYHIVVNGYDVDQAMANMAERNHRPKGEDLAAHRALMAEVAARRADLLRSTALNAPADDEPE